MTHMKKHLKHYVTAGYAGLYVVSHEEARAEAEIRAAALEAGFQLYAWSITAGIFGPVTGENPETITDTEDPMQALAALEKLPEKSILVLRDFHLLLQEANIMLIRRLKDALALGETSNRVILILGCRLFLQPELEKELTVLEFALPGRDELLHVLQEIAKSATVKLNGNTELILDAASGLTTTEAENAFALSIAEVSDGGKSGDILPAIVQREKSATVKKNGLLEIVDARVRLEDIGGLENLKRDLSEGRSSFTRAAREYGLPTRRGILVCGQPGTGKSLCATATGAIFGVPLLRLEAGRIFGSLVGESERNWRSAFATAKAIAPCVLWIDEVDGLFSGAESSGRTDGGTTSRVIKTILQDMQFNGEGVFFVFTANDIDGLPDPLIDRLDVWSVDLPTQEEREQIWSIHILKRKRDPKAFDLPALAKATDGFSGRQIEQVWCKALTFAFNDGAREPKTQDGITAAARFTPTSVTMKEAIEKRRKRLANRAQPASRPESGPVVSGARKLAVGKGAA